MCVILARNRTGVCHWLCSHAHRPSDTRSREGLTGCWRPSETGIARPGYAGCYPWFDSLRPSPPFASSPLLRPTCDLWWPSGRPPALAAHRAKVTPYETRYACLSTGVHDSTPSQSWRYLCLTITTLRTRSKIAAVNGGRASHSLAWMPHHPSSRSSRFDVI